jgi:biotin carboxyl carrier protein
MPEYRFQWDTEIVAVVVEPVEQGFAVTIDGVTTFVTAAQLRPGELDLAWPDGHRQVAWLAAAGTQRWVALGAGRHAGQSFELRVPQSASRRPRARQAHGRETLAAQMPGVVRRVLIGEGEHVVHGQSLVIMEAMKMEVRINAPEAGTVTSVSVKEGQPVERGQRLVEFSPVASQSIQRTTPIS